MSRWHSLGERVRSSRGAAFQRRYVQPRGHRGRWWAWPALGLPLALLLTVGVVRMIYLRAWPALVLLVVLFWPVWALINLPHYRAWQTRRRAKRARQASG
jgi:hypothetical protein